MDEVTFAIRILLVVVFTSAVLGKLGSRSAVADLGRLLDELPAQPGRIRTWSAPGLIAAESAVVGLLLLPGTARAGYAVAAVLLVAFTAGVSWLVRRGSTASCRCFGGSGQRLGRRHVVRNGLLAALAIGALATGTTALPASPAALLAGAAGALLGLLTTRWDDLAALATPASGRGRA